MRNQATEHAVVLDGIREFPERQGCRLLLPVRQLGPLRTIGFVLLGIGLFTMLFMIAWIRGSLSGLLSGGEMGPFGWFELVFALFGLPGLFMGLGLLAAGMAILRGRTYAEIAVSGGALSVVERCGIFRWTRRWKLGATPQLVVASFTPRRDRIMHGENEAFCALQVDDVPKPWIVTIGYPRTLLMDAARRIAAALPRTGSAAALPILVREIRNNDLVDEPEVSPVQPAGSNAIMQDVPGGLAITFPPAGLMKGTRGFFLFSLLWLVFSLTGFLAFAMAESVDGSRAGAFLMMSLFVAIGLGMLAISIHLGRRQVVLIALADRFAFSQTSPLRRSQAHVAREDIATIRVGPSGVEVNDRPVMQLQVVRKTGQSVGLLGGRDLAELQWLASLLRRHYGVTNQQGVDS